MPYKCACRIKQFYPDDEKSMLLCTCNVPLRSDISAIYSSSTISPTKPTIFDISLLLCDLSFEQVICAPFWSKISLSERNSQTVLCIFVQEMACQIGFVFCLSLYYCIANMTFEVVLMQTLPVHPLISNDMRARNLSVSLIFPGNSATVWIISWALGNLWNPCFTYFYITKCLQSDKSLQRDRKTNKCILSLLEAG